MVISFDLADDFVLGFCDYLENNFLRQGKDLSKLAVVFGGKRPAIFVKKELSRRIKKGFIPPHFFSIDEFVDYILTKDNDFRRISDIDACYLIYALAKLHAPAMVAQRKEFAQFLPWAKEALAFIEQLDLEDVQEERLSCIQDKAKIGYDVPEDINVLLREIVYLRQYFHQELKNLHSISRGLAYLLASRLVEKIQFDEFEQIFFCGFFYLHATEKRILKTLHSQGKATLFFQGSSSDWTVLKELEDDLKVEIQPSRINSPDYELSIFACPDTHAQMAILAQRLKNISDHSRAVVLVPEPENLIPLLTEITSVVNDFNVSIGYPLKRNALYSLLASIRQAQKTKRPQGYYAKDYLDCLGNPLVKNLRLFVDPAVTRMLVHKIEEVILGIEESDLAGSLFIRLEEIEKAREIYDLALIMIKAAGFQVSFEELREGLRILHDILFKNWEKAENFFDFSLSLQRLILLFLERAPFGSYPLNLKMAERIFALTEEFKEAMFKEEPFSQKDLFSIFFSRLESEVVSFSGSPLKGLQILGIFEARSLNFDHIFIVDANESILPRLKIYEPLIPREVMLSLGINRLEKEEQIQRYQFRRLIFSAKTVDLIYQETADKERSRFVEELIWEKEKSHSKVGAADLFKVGFQIKVAPKKMRIAKSASILDHLNKMVFSASSINTYLECPLRFYFSYVLNLEEKKELSDEPEAKDIGSFVHCLLQEAFSPYLNRRPLIDENFKTNFFQLLKKRFKDEFARKTKSDAFLIEEVLFFNLGNFLQFEAERPVKRIVSLESKFESKLFLARRKVSFKAIVDRIDQLEDGSFVVLDYKTGGRDIFPAGDVGQLEEMELNRTSIKENIKSFQLPLYLLILKNHKKFQKKNLNAALYFVKETGRDCLRSLFKNETSLKERDLLMQGYFICLEEIFKEIFDSDIPFVADEEEYQCRACPYFYLCR